jgi:hypothetical protein
MKKNCLLRLLVALVFLAATVSKGAQDDEMVFQQLSNSLNTVGAPLPGGASWGDQLDSLWARMNSDISTLQTIAKEHSLSPEYRQSVYSAAFVLMTLAAQNQKDIKNIHPIFGNWKWSRNWAVIIPRTEKVCSNIQYDLDTKVRYASQKPNDPFGTIEITVSTFQGAVETNGYDVNYVGLGWQDAGDMVQSFPGHSRTKGFLPAGYYTLWASKNEKNGAKKTITVDSNTQTIDLTVPPE